MDPDHLHFNEWAFMAKTDPEVFERCRERCINEWLSRTGKHRPCLEALQSKIDAERKRAGSPQQAVAAISEMMCASLCELAGELKCLSDDLKSLESRGARESERQAVSPA
jgi:hypothetical protein